MFNKLIYIIVLVLFLFTSCDQKLFVNKRYVVQKKRGFLVFREGETTFYPSKDTMDAKFLANKHKKEGYKIEFYTDWIDSLSIDYSYAYIVKNAKFSLIPVEVTYYLGDIWQKEDEENSIEYKWNNETFYLRFKQHDWRKILMVSIIRETDRKRLSELKIEPPSLHY